MVNAELSIDLPFAREAERPCSRSGPDLLVRLHLSYKSRIKRIARAHHGVRFVGNPRQDSFNLRVLVSSAMMIFLVDQLRRSLSFEYGEQLRFPPRNDFELLLFLPFFPGPLHGFITNLVNQVVNTSVAILSFSIRTGEKGRWR